MEGRLAAHAGPVFVCRIALNIVAFLDVFDRIILLRIDAATQEARLAAHDAAHPPGRTVAGRQEIRHGRALFETEMLRLGALSVDGIAPPSVVTDEVLRTAGISGGHR